MSIRIHTIAKEIGMDNKELLQLLLDREYDVKTVSSTIDNITADSLREEFKEYAANLAKADAPPPPPKPDILPGSFLPAAAVVKSAGEVEKERLAKLQAEGKLKPEAPKVIEPKPIGPQPIGSQPAAPTAYMS